MMTQAQKEQIIKNILIEVESSGSSRVGYHAGVVLKTDRPIPYNIKSKIEGSITSSKGYRSRPHPNFKNDFEILKEPDNDERRWHVKYPIRYEIFKAVLTALFALLVGITLWLISESKEDKRHDKLQQQIDQIKNR